MTGLGSPRATKQSAHPAQEEDSIILFVRLPPLAAIVKSIESTRVASHRSISAPPSGDLLYGELSSSFIFMEGGLNAAGYSRRLDSRNTVSRFIRRDSALIIADSDRFK